MIRLLIAASSHNIGGFETKIHTLLENLDRKEFRLYFVLIYPSYKAGEDSMRLRDRHSDYFHWDHVTRFDMEMKGRFNINQIMGLARLVRRNKIDILLFTAVGAGTFIAPFAAMLSGVPVLVRASDTVIEGLYPGILKILDRICLLRTDRVMVPSRFLMHLLSKELGIPESKMTVIPNGIPVEGRKGRSVRSLKKELGLPEGVKVVGMVANFAPLKAHEILIRAVPDILAGCPGTRFLLVGDGPLRGSIEKLAQSLGIAQYLHFTGYRPDTAELARIYDVGILSSRVEVHPISLIEIMAAGVPVVAPRVGGIPEIVEDGVSGLLVRPGDPESLAKGILKVLRDPALAKKIGASARSRVLSDFTQKKMLGKIEELLKNLNSEAGKAGT